MNDCQVNNKIQTAIEFLKNDRTFLLGEIRLGIIGSGSIEVAGWSQWLNIENISKQNSLKELERIKSFYSEIIAGSSELQHFVKGKDTIFSLYFDDGGKTSIAICSERNAALLWHLAID